jgi:hypothetical protein
MKPGAVVVEWTRSISTRVIFILIKPRDDEPTQPSVPIRDPVIGFTTTQDGGW